MSQRPLLGRLAERMGILPSFTDAEGARRDCTDTTREALLAAMGLDASSEAAARGALDGLAAKAAARWLDPVCVAPASQSANRVVAVRMPAGKGTLGWRLEIASEAGEAFRSEGQRRAGAGGARLALPTELPEGVHEIRVALRRGRGPWVESVQRRIVVPASCLAVEEVLGGRRAFGLTAHLYSLRRSEGFGAGDFSELGALIDLASAEGAAFVGLNPLHALWHVGEHVSPYAPVSRLYRSPLYVDLCRVPEWREAPLDGPGEPAEPAALARLRAAPSIPYDEISSRKRVALGALFERFQARARAGQGERSEAFARYREREGAPLRAFATFLALAEHLGERDWRRWPSAWRRPDAPAVQRFARECAGEVAFHEWAQFELDRQWTLLARRARERLEIGLMTDLALGSSAGGADTWAFPDIFAHGARAGAPPDAFTPHGQDWGLPPLHPHALRERGYRYWQQLLRANFADAGALRLDHAMSLCRLYWIPEGRRPAEGAYVRYPERELLGILALESRRARALVVGEDLGTLPRGLASRLARRQVISTRVLLFERSGEVFRPASRYSTRALVTANTHDLPTLAGWWKGTDLGPRRAAGHLADDAALAEARKERADSRKALRRRLEADGLLAPGENEPAAVAAAVTAFLCRTPAPLVGIAVDDLAAEELPLNLPGVPQDRYPSWHRPLRVPLEELADQPAATSMLESVPSARRSGGRWAWRSTRGSSARSTTCDQR